MREPSFPANILFTSSTGQRSFSCRATAAYIARSSQRSQAYEYARFNAIYDEGHRITTHSTRPQRVSHQPCLLRCRLSLLAGGRLFRALGVSIRGEMSKIKEIILCLAIIFIGALF